ncbi:type II-A CRISPR-associated protein Csn2 [Lentilactobacillus buchneri]|uniref:Type II-A CRISPR-associated protein Csn2 n=1 Tax=Lentilactobacillus buchneri DSM 20057 TaxID=1423728 RepID=A0A4R5NVL6_LENBU|nr:type II-A CRISPR-associated protein Csn2 [Lentilactobacillus buchneri]AEB74121.1 CRISPR-associated Csn2 family protein [Lentilactobacillus buchneri NRRL B-30929]KRK67249.1 CRISPR-associated Csn2 family protein [Lentilactobacillus buchneri DSM 20057]MCT2898961.1 type II-A CRISPR-associated protein Csn2 [Lentilactobacillus buchneri]MCT3251754.1 type II-A CRISPR-associated protein Csn2 [Lentilactobacillus buchneri]MCT3546342.1 type II-A CRISPR-associated protein Csn2 [Lentilactobacillus buchne
MKISYAGHQEIELNSKNPTVIATNNPTVYHDLVVGLSSFSDKVKVFDDNFELVEVKDVIDWQGDVGLSDGVSDKYNSGIFKQLEAVLTDDQRKSITDINNQLYTVVQQCLFMIDLPLEVTYDWDLKRLFKYCKIHFNTDAMQNPYAIIESIIKIHLECGLKSAVGLTNVAHYLNQQQFIDLSNLASSTGISTLLVEFTDMKSQELYTNCDFYYIDEDFVDWHL